MTKQYCDQLHKCLTLCNEVFSTYPVESIAGAVSEAEGRYKHYLYGHEEVTKMFRMMADIAPSSSSNNNTNCTTKSRSNNSNSSIHMQSLMSAKDKIRLKHIHEYTSQDELDFACLDMALYCNNNTATTTTNNSNNNNNNNNDNKSNSTNNTLLYTHLSPIEKEEIRFRSPNISNYPYFRLNFLLNLPEQINLALPFLYSEHDIHIYYLINKYYRQHDDIYYQYIDHTTGSNSSLVHTNSNNSTNNSITSSADYAAYCVSYMQARDPSYIPSDTSSIEHAEAVLTHECIDIRVKYHFIRAYLEQNGHNSDLSSLLLGTLSSTFPTTGGGDGPSGSNMGSIAKARAGVKSDVKAIPLLTREQYAWMVLDYSLNPHLYQPLDTSITYPDTTTTTNNNTTTSPTAPPQHDSAAVLNILHIIEGILGPPLTSTADETATDLTDTLSIYTRSRLLQLHEDGIYTDANPGDLDGYVSTLLRRYYLPTDATALDYDRLVTLAKLDNIINPPVVTEPAHTNAATDGAGVGSDSNGLRRRGSVANRRASLIPIPPRVYGSWEQVHPAALGAQSQSTPFVSYDYDPRLHHPGSYSAIPVHTHRSTTTSNSSTDNALNPHLSLQSRSSNTTTNNSRFTHLTPQMRTGYTLLTSGTTSANHTTTSQTIYTEYTSSYLIIPSLTDLATMSLYDIANKDVLIENKSEPALCILSQQNNSLLTRQSKSHQFEIYDHNTTSSNSNNSTNNKNMLDITISIIYQGIFTTTGEYKCGRIGGSLFRIPSKIDKNPSFSSPIPLGYSPIDLQAPNSISQFGRLCIIHRPKLRPLLPGVYQVVLGCGKYACIYVYVIVY